MGGVPSSMGADGRDSSPEFRKRHKMKGKGDEQAFAMESLCGGRSVSGMKAQMHGVFGALQIVQDGSNFDLDVQSEELITHTKGLGFILWLAGTNEGSQAKEWYG